MEANTGTGCHMSLAEYIQYCCTGRIPEAILQTRKKSPFLNELICLADLLGAIEPLCATRPGVCDPVVDVKRDIFVPPATMNEIIVPSEVRAISICAPMNRAIVVDELQLVPANLTAAESGEVLFKRVNLAQFGDSWCLPFEPIGGPGVFVNVEHIVTPPQAGWSVYAVNNDPTSEAVFTLKARMWACC